MVSMKRKQLHLTELELRTVIDAMRNEWWIEYDPAIETSIQPNYDLLRRFEDAYEKITTES